MYRAKFMVTTAMALMLGLGTSAMAAGSGDQQSGTTMQPSTSGTSGTQSGSASVEQWQSRADQVIDQTVVTPEGEEIGDVEDLVVNPSDQQVYAVIGVGGFLGMGEKQVAVSADQLQMQGEQIVLTQSKEQIQQMAEYNGQWQSIRERQGETGTTPGASPSELRGGDAGVGTGPSGTGETGGAGGTGGGTGAGGAGGSGGSGGSGQ